jgi:NAD(P)-dependent dehydrogenase (short-subunit alcohol dehydrogenase family)
VTGCSDDSVASRGDRRGGRHQHARRYDSSRSAHRRGRSAPRARSARREIAEAGGRAQLCCDVASSAAVAETARAAEAALGAVDVLANVAGIGDRGGAPIESIEDAVFHGVLAVNLAGPFYFCRALLPGMAERGRGAVVNVSSLAGRTKSALGGLAYTASKSACSGSRAISLSTTDRAVRVNAICSGRRRHADDPQPPRRELPRAGRSPSCAPGTRQRCKR